MGWLPFFSNKKSQVQSPSNYAETQNSTNSTTVVQILVEETIMAVAQWLITFVNRSIVKQSVQSSQTNPQADKSEPSQAGASNPLPPLEELLSKFGTLVEQLSQREQEITPLHNRISELETTLKQSCNFEYSFEKKMQTFYELISALENRLMQVEQQIQRLDMDTIEASLQQHNSLAAQAELFSPMLAALDDRLTRLENVNWQEEAVVEGLDQANQATRLLEARIDHLEKLLARFSVIPKMVEGNYRAIASLHSRIESSKALSNGNHKNTHHDAASVIRIR